MVTHNNYSITRKLIIPVIILFFLLAVIFLGSFLKFNSVRQQEIIDMSINSIPSVLEHVISQQTVNLRIISESIVDDVKMKEFLASKDRESLYSHYKTFNEKINKQYHVTHFYFHDSDKRNLLRMYKPDKYGDLITRYTFNEAVRRGSVFSGMEVGKYGTFTLRVVRPIFLKGEIIGYLEIGKEIEEIISIIRDHYSVDFAVLIAKDKVKQSKWQQGMKMLGRNYDWSKFDNHVITYYSSDTVMALLDNAFSGQSVFLAGAGDVSYQNQQIYYNVLPFNDISGSFVGKMVVFFNVTDQYRKSMLFVVFTVFVSLVLFTFLLWFFYKKLKRFEHDLVISQQKLENEAHKFQTAFNNASDTILWIDPETETIVNCNQGIKALLNKSSQDIVGKHFSILYPESKQHEYSGLFTEYKKGYSRTMEIEVVTKEGKEKIVNIATASFSFGDKTIIQAVFRDVTLIQKLSRQYKENLVFIEKLMDVIPNPIVYKDNKGVYQKCNKAFADLVGKKAEDVIGLTVFDIAPKEVAELFVKSDEDLLKTKGKSTAESKIFSHDGKEKDVVFYKNALVDENGKVNGIMTVLHDISDFKKIERHLHDAEEKLAVVMRNIKIGICVVDENMHVVYSNRQVEKWFPHVEGTENLKCHDILNHDGQGKVCTDCPAKESFEKGKITRAVIKRFVGYKKFVFDVTACPVFDKEGQVAGIVELIDDITEKQNSEYNIKKRIAYEEGISKCSQILLQMPSDALQRVLTVLQEAAAVSRVCLFENTYNEKKEFCMTKLYEALSSSEKDSVLADPVQNKPYSEGFSRWEKELKAGRVIKGNVYSFPKEERSFFKKYDVVSVLAFPVFANDGFYGFIEFDSVKDERIWDERDMYILKTVSELIGLYLAHKS